VLVRDAMAAPGATVGDIARIVAADTAVAGKILQLVNSAFFRAARRITNVEQAVAYLGFAAVRNLVMSAEVFSQWSDVQCAAFDPDELQQHAHVVAAAMAALTKRTSAADDAVLVGVLHDIGYWLLAQECPRELEQAVALARHDNIPLHEAEVKLMGASHAELGAYLLGLWGLPFNVIEAVAHHHTPHNVRQTGFDLLAALALAHTLTRADGNDSSIEYHEPDVDQDFLAGLNAPFDWNEAVARVRATQAAGE
jgi:HD-like signal output (HDOD) protein